RRRELQALHRPAEARHGIAERDRSERLATDAEHEIVMQRTDQRRLRLRGRMGEIDALDRERHVSAELLLLAHGRWLSNAERGGQAAQGGVVAGQAEAQ